MKTIEDTAKKSAVTATPVPSTPPAPAIAPLDEPQQLPTAPLPTGDSFRLRQSLQQQIFLLILPFIVVPLTMSGWLAFHRSNQPAPDRSQQSASVATQAENWYIDLIALLAIGTINIGMAVWIVRRIANSIDRVTTKLTEAANGDLSVQLDPNGSAEFQALANGFNQLVTNFDRTLQQQQLAAQSNQLYGKIASIAQESVDRLQVYQTGASGIRRILQADRVAVFQCHLDGTASVIAESVGSGQRATIDTPLGQMYFAELPTELERYSLGQSVTFNDLQQVKLSPNRQQSIAQMGVKSMTIVPILAGKQLIGLVSIQQCDRVRHWQAWEIAFGIQAAQRLGLAIEQIMTWNTQAIELHRSNLLSQALQVNEPAESIELLDRAVASIREEFNLDRLMVFGRSDRERGEIMATAMAPAYLLPDAVMMNQYLQYELDREDSALGQISCIYSLDAAGGLKSAEISLLEQLQIRARMVAPILVEGQILGLVIGQVCNGERKWTLGEIDRFTTVADRIGLVLERRKSIERKAVQAARKDLVLEITQQLRSSLDRETIITTALTSMRTAAGLDRAVFVTFSDNFPTQIGAEAVAPGTLSILGEVLDRSLFDRQQILSYGKGQISTIADIERAGLTDVQIANLQRLQVRASVFIPILVNNKLAGLIVGDMCHATRNWEPELLETLAQIAVQVGLVLNQAQLFAQREDDARKLQIISNFTL
ncbi:GAF domain-containing protein, partial [Chamaesiphon sp. OTE_20_metabat_361]|uniref:GAF domain-containing protein n=1 Tax=Chamaesiphon sp. OTE_20_metabat_361 TaxID=2964689 RepID=UPI00286BF15A